ncbi:DUF3387 domain-containing protein [Candidatus Poribacteria bacterium]|nr:DUF3387 domain-containing protein [Candidatus Poribacteria bacterium]
MRLAYSRPGGQEIVKAMLRVMVKRLLRKYDYRQTDGKRRLRRCESKAD